MVGDEAWLQTCMQALSSGRILAQNDQSNIHNKIAQAAQADMSGKPCQRRGTDACAS